MPENRRLQHIKMRITLRDLLFVLGGLLAALIPSVFDYTNRLSVVETKIEQIQQQTDKLTDEVIRLREHP